MIITALCISDTHGWMSSMDSVGLLPDSDLLIHAGDLSIWSEEPRHQEEMFRELQFLEQNQHRFKHMIIVPGNHDESIQQKDPAVMGIINRIPNLHLLLDEMLVLDEFHGLKIYGSPWVPLFDKSFAKSFSIPVRSEELRKKRQSIPKDIDILITHTPPEHCLDSVKGYDVGCSLLRDRLDEQQPSLHVFGHVHDANGHRFSGEQNSKCSINAAICNMALSPFYQPHRVDIFCEQDEKPLVLRVEIVNKRAYEIQDRRDR